MTNYFVFDGYHSLDDLGLEVELVSLPLFPEPKTVYDDIPGTDGELNLSTVNPNKRLCFKPRIIEFKCHGTFDPERDGNIHSKLSEITKILCSGEDKTLILSGQDEYYYKGHAANLFNVTIESDSSFSFPLVFKCQPFRIQKKTTYIESENNILRIENDGYYTDFTLSVDSFITTEPIIIRSNRYPDRELKINTLIDGTLLTIDTEKRDVILNGTSVLSECSGDFFDLAPGTNVITFDTGKDEYFFGCSYNKKYL